MKRLLLATVITTGAFAQSATNPAEDGPKIIAEAFGRLSAALAEAIAQGGPASALSVCSEKAPQIAAEVGKAHGVTLRRATTKPRNPKNAADDAETAVLAAFADAMAKKEAPKPQTITNADGSTSFLAPIAPETLAAIQKLYPEDKATGFKLSDLRGLWSITFPAK